MNRVKTLLAFVLILILPLALSSQLADLEFDESPLSVSVNESKLANSYEYLIKSTLSKYLEKNTYEVDANVSLELVKKPIKYKTIRINVLGDVNLIDEFGDIADEQPPMEDLVLPGTGGRLLSDFVETRDSVVVSEFSSDYKISRMSVFVLLDEAIYTNDEILFVEEMIRMKADIDEYRGDIVEVTLQRFPPKQETPQAAAALQEDAEDLQVPDEPQQAQPETPQPEEKQSNLPTILIIVAIFLVFLAAIIFLIIYLQKGNKNNEFAPGAMNIPRYDEQFDTLMDEIRGIRNMSKLAPQPAKAEEAEFSNLRTFTVNKFMGDPKNVALVASSWIDNNSEEGITEASKLIKSIDENLVDLLEKSISAENFRLLSWNVRNMDELATKEKIEILQKFKNAWKALPVADSAEEEIGMFGFLSNLSAYQISKILQGESEGVKALVLTQLDESSSSEMLDKMTSEERSSVLVNMGKLDRIPASIFKDVSARLSKAALAMSDMKYVVSDGVSKIIKILYNLPIAKQNEYVEEITRTDVEIANEIVKFFITWDELPDLEDEILIPAIQKIDIEIFSSALVGVSTTFSDKILSLIPARMRERVNSELEMNSRKLKSDQIEAARKSLMEVVKKEIWARGGRKIVGDEDEGEETIEY